MPDVTATHAARNLSDLLDAVERSGERFTITRYGKPVARLGPTVRGRGADAKALLRRHRPDPGWAQELSEVRDLLRPIG